MQDCITDDWLLGRDLYVAEARVKTTVSIDAGYSRTVVDENKNSSTHYETHDALTFTFEDNFINTEYSTADYFFDEQHSELVQDYNLDPDQSREPQITLGGSGTYSERESNGESVDASWDYILKNTKGIPRPNIPLHVHYKPYLPKGTTLGYEIPKKVDPQIMMLNNFLPPSPSTAVSNLVVSGSETIKRKDVVNGKWAWITTTSPISSLGATHSLAFGYTDEMIQDWIDNGPKLAGTDMKYEKGAFRISGRITHTYSSEPQQGDPKEKTDEKTDISGTLSIEYEIRVRARVRHVIVNQALAFREVEKKEKPDDIIDDILTGLVLAAGKESVIQVFFPDGLSVDDVGDITVDVFKDDKKLTTLCDYRKDEKNSQVIFLCNRKDCSGWEEGTYKLVARVPELIIKKGDKEYNATTSLAQFRKKRDISILAVPIRANFGNGDIREPENDWKDVDFFLRLVYPLADENIHWKISETALDCSHEKYNLTKQGSMIRIWAKLHQLRKSDAYDFIVGLLASSFNPPSGQVGFEGITHGTSCIVVKSLNTAMVIAHEIGHCLELGDEYSIKDNAGVPLGHFNLAANCPPFGYEGRDLHDPSKLVRANDEKIHPFPDGPAGTTGTLIPAKIFPYHQGGPGLKEDSQSFMGRGTSPLIRYWVTPAIWYHLYDALNPKEGYPASPPAGPPKDAPVNEGGKTRMADASGWIGKSGQVELEMPWRSYTTADPSMELPDLHENVYVLGSTPVYAIVAVDASGKKLAVQTFRPLSYSPFSDPPSELDPAPFVNVHVPFPEGTTKFQITRLGKSGTTYTWDVLKDVLVSPHTPVVSITEPSGGSLCSGPTTIAWTASHPDGVKLFFDVEFSHDGQEWTVLAMGISQNQLTEDFNILPGGDHAYVRVIASDGINSVIATSAAFNVPDKAPEVFIQEPVLLHPGIVLQGRAYDLIDTWIYKDSRLSWTSDRDGALGQGSRLFVKNPSPGQHLITLKATNSHGLSTDKSIPVKM